MLVNGVRKKPKNNKITKRLQKDYKIINMLLTFDEKCNRLGFGKGYYDRFLKSSGIKTIGICFENQVLKDDILPTQKHDVLMDCIITEERIISKDMQKYNMYLKEKGM